MQQTGTWRQLEDTELAPSHPKDSPSPDEREPVGSDTELFIRRTFESDARLGCELLFRHHYETLCGHAVRFVGSKAVAEDLVAEMFCQFYEQQIFATITSSYRAYLYKTIRNRAYNYVRQTFYRNLPLDNAQFVAVSGAEQPDAVSQYDELYQRIEKAIESLPVKRRQIYLMHRFDGKRYSEIAQELELSVRTVEAQIRLASHALREVLKERWALLVLYCLSELSWYCIEAVAAPPISLYS